MHGAELKFFNGVLCSLGSVLVADLQQISERHKMLYTYRFFIQRTFRCGNLKLFVFF
jgi:hypothetical protein